MQRRNLLTRVKAYANDHPEERSVADRFVHLLETQPRCFERDCWAGHVTGSAWLLDPAYGSLLLTHHRKLDIWVQLGGHSDGDPDTAAVAVREAEEESGLQVRLLDPAVFDLDIHEIPARKGDPVHFHYDVRFAMVAAGTHVTVSEESHALRWVALSDLERFTTETSILRMRAKWLARADGLQ